MINMLLYMLPLGFQYTVKSLLETNVCTVNTVKTSCVKGPYLVGSYTGLDVHGVCVMFSLLNKLW